MAKRPPPASQPLRSLRSPPLLLEPFLLQPSPLIRFRVSVLNLGVLLGGRVYILKIKLPPTCFSVAAVVAVASSAAGASPVGAFAFD